MVTLAARPLTIFIFIKRTEHYSSNGPLNVYPSEVYNILNTGKSRMIVVHKIPALYKDCMAIFIIP